MSYGLLHAHSHFSNFRLRDSINKIEDLIDYCYEQGLKYVTITDHECLSGHVKAQQYIEKNKNKFNSFQVFFGNEIYLVEQDKVLELKKINEKIPFYHFILIAKNQNGYEGLKKLSSLAWKENFYYKGMQRVPTYKHNLETIMKEYKGDIIASTACLGGELPSLLLNNEISKAEEFINWCLNLFQDDFYIELQPNIPESEQDIANKLLYKISKKFNIKCIVTTDAHYLSRNDSKAHEIYLKSSNGDREVSEFYKTTYVMSKNELSEYFKEDLLDELCLNTLEIRNKIQDITFKQSIQVPKAHIPNFELNNLFESYYEEFEYIKKFAKSKSKINRYYLHLIANGMVEKKQKLDKETLSRINLELNEIYHVSKNLNQEISSYFVLTKELVDLMWEVSIVGPSRGSAACYYTNYLLDIVQVNPLKYNLPHWRFLSQDRPTLPDIDLDGEGSKRYEILRLIKERYGEDSVLNIGTFTTEGSRSAVLTSCRGYGIDIDIAQNLSKLIPTEKGGIWSLSECFYGNEEKNKKPAKEFINEVEKYPGLKQTMLTIEGLVSGRGQHASALVIYDNGYIKQNAMMTTTSNLPITQFDAIDTEFMGGLKNDMLSIDALGRIREAIELLLKYKKIEWQGTLRETYNKYFHPDVLEMNAKEMFDLLYEGKVLDAFQYTTPVGQQTLKKLNASTFDELCIGNNLMRLNCEGEQPLDKFIKFKEDINLWYQEMKKYGLNNIEIEILKNLLLKNYGICDSQELIMKVIMDKNISNYNLTEANKYRKLIAKQNKNELEIEYKKYINKGLEVETRKVFLDYVWENCFKPSFSYSFSSPHTTGYTLILMIEMNICYRYGFIYWQTACLSVNSGLSGESIGGTNYGAIAKAVGDMKGIIKNPDINLSQLEFTPIEKTNQILFGLKPIAGLSNDSIEIIINNRPYENFNDFLLKINISNKQIISLIKSGCFDCFSKDRKQIMIDFINYAIKNKEKITMVQLPILLKYIDKNTYKEELEIYEFRNKIFGRNKIKIDKEIEKEFINKYSNNVEYTFENEQLSIDNKSFDKYYKKSILNLNKWIRSNEALDLYNKLIKNLYWKENCSGNKESWEIETLLFYSDNHEFDLMPIDEYFTLSNFFKLPEDPIKINNGKFSKFKIDVIGGTVVEKNKAKSLIYLLTQNGLVIVNYSKNHFDYYDKKIVEINEKEKIVLDSSWFERGTKLIIVGFRRGDQFVPRKTGSLYNHTTYRIEQYNKEKIKINIDKIQ